MSIGTVGSFNQATAAQAVDNSAKVQLERVGRKVETDTRVQAEAAPAEAAPVEPAPVEAEAKVVAGTLGTQVDMYL